MENILILENNIIRTFKLVESVLEINTNYTYLKKFMYTKASFIIDKD